MAIQLLLFILQLELQSDWGEEWLQMLEKVLFRHTHVPIEKK